MRVCPSPAGLLRCAPRGPTRQRILLWTARFAQPATLAAGASSASAGTRATVPLRILIAKDHDISRGASKRSSKCADTARLLSRTAMKCCVRSNGRSSTLCSWTPSTCRSSTVEAAAAIRRGELRCPRPDHCARAESTPGLRDGVLASGMTEYLDKPLKPEVLFTLIDGLGRRPSSAESESQSPA